MEMGRSGNGSGGKVVTFDDAVSGRRRSGSSLSSYLDMGRDVDGGRATPRPLPLPAHTMASRRYADGELDVFSAERYFKGAMDGEGDRKEGFSVTSPAVAVQVQQPFLVETAAAPARSAAKAVVMAKPSSTRASTVSFTTASSAASSANSQTALFRGGLRRRRGNRCCVQVGVLMRTCSGKRSVRVDGCAAKEAPDDDAVPAAATGIDWYRELRVHKAALGLSGNGNTHGLVAAGLPPSLNLGGTAKVAAIGREMTGGEEKEAAELTFSSSTRRRSNFTLVAPVRANVPATGRVGEPGGRAGKGGQGGGAHHLHDEDDEDEDDAGSESSSDLFEIKSLMIDDSPYEPSEASIQWSVVTADAASERGDRVAARWVGGGGAARRPPVAGSRQLRGHRPAGILAGCASHRAVDVSAATTKAVPNAAGAVVPVAMQQRRSEGFHMARNGA